MRHTFVVLGICLAVGSLGATEPRWIEFDDGAGEVRIDAVQSSSAGVEVTVELPGIEVGGIGTEGGSFVRVEIPGVGRIGATGEPELPALRRFVEVPDGAHVEVDAQVLERRTIDLATEGLTAPLLPVQLPRPKCDCEEARAWRFSYKPEAYRGTVERPIAALSGPFTFRDHRMMLLTVSPVTYDADRGRLDVAVRTRLVAPLRRG